MGADLPGGSLCKLHKSLTTVLYAWNQYNTEMLLKTRVRPVSKAYQEPEIGNNGNDCRLIKQSG